MTNVTSEATSMAPDATRYPPTPRTTSSETCRATKAIGTMNADTRAMRTPAA